MGSCAGFLYICNPNAIWGQEVTGQSYHTLQSSGALQIVDDFFILDGYKIVLIYCHMREKAHLYARRSYIR